MTFRHLPISGSQSRNLRCSITHFTHEKDIGMPTANTGVLQIIGAAYGLKQVTAQVIQLVNRKTSPETLSVQASNTVFTDTWPGFSKTLTVVYSYDGGAPQTVSATENQTLSIGSHQFELSETAPAFDNTQPLLTVWGATYGPANVGAQVRGMIQPASQSLALTANNATFTDPWVNHRKTFVIVASYTNQVPFTDIVIEGSPYALKYRPHLQILSAFWGLGDVTSVVQANVSRRNLNIAASNAVFGDGWPGIAKTLDVVYQYAECKPQLAITTEGNTLSVDYDATVPAYKPPADASALNVIAAAYGQADVTSKVTALIANQSLNLTANNATFSDSWLNHVKSFSMVYSWGSAAVSSLVVAEGQPVLVSEPDPIFTTDQNFVSMAGLFASGDQMKLQTAAGGYWAVAAGGQITTSGTSSDAAETFTIGVPGAAGSAAITLQCHDGSYVTAGSDGTLHSGGTAQTAAQLIASLQSNGTINLGIVGGTGAPFMAVTPAGAIAVSGNYNADFSTCFNLLFNPTQAGTDNHLKAFARPAASNVPIDPLLVKVIWDLTGGCFLAIGLGPLMGNAERLGPGVMNLLAGYPRVMALIDALVATVRNNRAASAGALLVVLKGVYEAGIFMPLVRLILSMAGWWGLSWAVVTILTKVLGGAATAGATLAAELIASFAIWAYQTTMDILAYVNSSGGSKMFAEGLLGGPDLAQLAA
jgi:hypothetical protein